MRKRLLKIIVRVLFVIFIGGGVFYIVTWYGFREEVAGAEFGVTFSTVMARQLGFEPREVFDAIVDDLGARKIRLPVYWSEVEKKEGEFDFEGYDYLVKKSEDAGVKLILAMGRKLPRWPECYEPEWARMKNTKIKMQNLLNYIETVVKRYKNSSAVGAWQVENEPFFAFGKHCAEMELEQDLIREEISLVRSLDGRPIIVTDSGEQGLWFRAAKRGDILGITMYRQSWNDFFGVSHFPFGPGFYAIKEFIFRTYEVRLRKFTKSDFVRKTAVVELQAEPWGKELLPLDSLDFQKELMNAEQFRKNISYARRTGFDTFYLWGAEWWYWLKEKQSDASLWEEAGTLF